MPKPSSPTAVLVGILVLTALIAGLRIPTSGRGRQTNISQPSFERMDAHFHAASTDPALFDLLHRPNIRVLNLSADDRHERGFKDVDLQHVIAHEMLRQSDGRVVWTAALDPALLGPKSGQRPEFTEVINKQLGQAFADGAVGVKITKSISTTMPSYDSRI